MGVIRKIVAALDVAALVVTIVGIGFIACVAPPVTHALSNAFSDDVTSPFTRSELVQVADATRDYSFGSHDLQALYAAIYEVDRQFVETVERTGGALPSDFPKLNGLSGDADAQAFGKAFAGASEMYCFSSDTISHLDDCHAIARIAYPLLAVTGIAAIALLIAIGVLGGRRSAGSVLIASGAVAIVVFIGLGIGAVCDFAGLFALFHGVFFSQGNWTFPYDSLLICALPSAFWMGMGAVWLATSTIVAFTLAIVGWRLIRL